MTHQEHQQQQSLRSSGKKVLLAALTATIVTTTNCSAFQPPRMVASLGGGRSSSSSKLNYAVTWEGSSSTVGIRKTEKVQTIPPQQIDNHGYRVANHDHERSFWLHALQNLEPSSSSNDDDQSLWRRIAVANAPEPLTRILSDDALLVRVGDTDLDIVLAVPSESWDPSFLNAKTVVAATKDSRFDRHQVTIRVDFPEGSSFDKDAFTFEDELIAVIQQVRLLEQSANNKLSSQP